MSRTIGAPFVDADDLPDLLEELDRHPLLVVGGRQRSHRSMRDGSGWYGYGGGIVLRIDGSGVTTVLEYESRPDTYADGDAVLFKSATCANGRLYCCTQTEVVIYRMQGSLLVEENHVSLPIFNDVHHVVPTANGTLLVAVSGLELVVEITPDGSVVREWDVLGDGLSTWERFDPTIDYRMGVNLKPHRAHPNHIVIVDGEPFVTRFELRDVISLDDPTRRIAPGGERLHDGVFHDGRIWFTSVDGEVIVADATSLEIVDRMRLGPRGDGEPLLGWCRGLRVNDEAMWLGFSRIRATQLRQTLSWIRNRGTSQAPTRIARYERDTGRCSAEIDLEPYGLNAVFSVISL
jgi:hypothetical protein